MIFSHTHHLLLPVQRKFQTLRLARCSDYLGKTATGEIAVNEDCGFGRIKHDDGSFEDVHLFRSRWIVGHIYAIQTERCHPAIGYFRCSYLREVLDPTRVDADFARAEGFDTVKEYLDVWHKLHSKNPVQRCWAIGIGEVKRTKAEMEIPTAKEFLTVETAEAGLFK